MTNKYIWLVMLMVAVAVGFTLWQHPAWLLGLGSASKPAALSSLLTGELVPAANELEVSDEFTTGPIQVTNGVKHSVPLQDIVGGGPPRDGIPSIDRPIFISQSEANGWLKDDELGLAVEQSGSARFYPFQILVWHEIVNDTFQDKRVLITYCPLCFSAIVFDPLVSGERVEFGTSGKLWNSNLVMYDRKTESLWSQILGEAIAGEMTGTRLAVLPSDQTTYGQWKKAFPQGEVLSRETGALRFYGRDPYGDYYTSPGLFFPVQNRDRRLEEKELILGLVIGNEAKAYLPSAIQQAGELTDTFAGKTIVVRYDATLDVVRFYEPLPDGSEQRLNPFSAYWFTWAAVHPGTELYQ